MTCQSLVQCCGGDENEEWGKETGGTHLLRFLTMSLTIRSRSFSVSSCQFVIRESV